MVEMILSGENYRELLLPYVSSLEKYNIDRENILQISVDILKYAMDSGITTDEYLRDRSEIVSYENLYEVLEEIVSDVPGKYDNDVRDELFNADINSIMDTVVDAVYEAAKEMVVDFGSFPIDLLDDDTYLLYEEIKNSDDFKVKFVGPDDNAYGDIPANV